MHTPIVPPLPALDRPSCRSSSARRSHGQSKAMFGVREV